MLDQYSYLFNPNYCPVMFRLKRICEIYSKVLRSEEALHVSLCMELHCHIAIVEFNTN